MIVGYVCVVTAVDNVSVWCKNADQVVVIGLFYGFLPWRPNTQIHQRGGEINKIE